MLNGSRLGQVITAASLVAVSRTALIALRMATVVFVTLPLVDDLASLGMHIQLDPPARLVGWTSRFLGMVLPGDEIDFRVGDSLRHTQWGEGMILDLRGQGPDTQATVRFADGGAEKVLLLKWAPVEKI